MNEQTGNPGELGQAQGSELSGGLGRWIPCNERLPEELEKVLFFGPELLITGGEAVKGYRYGSGAGGWAEYPDGGSFDLSDVTHWMPLPEPPAA